MNSPGKQTTVRTIASCIVGNFFFRMSAEATAILLALYLSYVNNYMHPIAAFVVGVLGTGYYISQLGGAPIMGALSDLKGRKLLMFLGPLLSAVVVQFYPMTASVLVIFILLTLEGLSAAMRAPAALSFLSDATSASEKARGRTMGIYQMSILCSMVCGYVLGGLLWDQAGTNAFKVITGTYLMGIGIILVGLEEPLQRSRREPQDIQRYLRVVTHPTVIRFLPAWIGLNAIMGAWLSQTTFQLSAHPISTGQMLLGRFSGTQIGLILACFAILFAVGTVVWGLLIGRLSKMTILLLASLGIYLCCMALLIINHPLAATPASLSAPVLLAVVLLGAGIFVQSGFTPAAFAYLADLSEKFRAERGAIIGVYYLFLSGGQLLGIWLGGISAQLAQVDGLILLSAALVSVVFATLLLIRARTTRG